MIQILRFQGQIEDVFDLIRTQSHFMKKSHKLNIQDHGDQHEKIQKENKYRNIPQLISDCMYQKRMEQING